MTMKNIRPVAGTDPAPILKQRPMPGRELNPLPFFNPFGSKTNPTIRVQILNPQPPSTVVVDKPFLLEASAEKGAEDLSSKVYWYSSLDGFLGRGESVEATLSGGYHIITALVVHLASTRAKAKSSTRAKAKTSMTPPGESGLSVGIDTVSIDPTPYE